MYRLLKLRGATLHYSYTTSVHANVQQSSQVCSFCKFTHRRTPTHVSLMSNRQRSTTTNMAVDNNPVKRKVKNRTKKYAELLEITDSTTSNRKAAIQIFNASQMSILVDRPEIDLDNLHEIKNSQRNSSYASSNIKFMDDKTIKQTPKVLADSVKVEEGHDCVLEELNESGILDQTHVIKNMSLLQSLEVTNDVHHTATEEPPSNIKPASKKHINKLKKEQNKLQIKEKINELNLKAKEETLNKNLCAYINICINSGMISKAFMTLMHYKRIKLEMKHVPPARHVLLYEELISAYAKTTNIKGIIDILNVIDKENLRVNEQILAPVFECIARMKHSIIAKELLKIMKHHIEQSNITLDAIINNVKFFENQQDYVIKGMRLLNPDYVPTYHPPDTNYQCNLMNNIFEQPHMNCIPFAGLFTKEDLLTRLEAQVNVELTGHLEIMSIDKQSAITEELINARTQVKIMEDAWRTTAEKAFVRQLNALRKRELRQSDRALLLHPYLQVLDVNEYINAILQVTKQLLLGSESFSPSLSLLYNDLGRRIFTKYEIMMKERNGVVDKTIDLYSQYFDWYLTGKDYPNSRVAWQNLEHKNRLTGTNPNITVPQWPPNILSDVGRFLFSIILKDFKFAPNGLKPEESSRHSLPAFYTLYRVQGRVAKQEVKPHPNLMKLYQDSKPETLTFNTDLLPTQCPPRPWISTQSSGYVLSKISLIRYPYKVMRQKVKMDSIPAKDIYPALDSLNQLSNIPWVVNNSVLDIAIEVFQNGGSEKLNIPQPPSVLSPPPPLSSKADSAERKRVLKLRSVYKREGNEMYSLWCDALYRLSLANHFRNDIFWLPHNMDFRGRVYPVPPHLNHLGADLARSLLVFAQRKPLGQEGLDWLKIHAINLTGFKKQCTIAERLRYADEILDDILDSADNPLTGKMWWTTSDKPWQTLAVCKEIAEALKSENPAEYLSGFPIHQDGSCNGLQHYAALGRDQIGAYSVNLYPTDKPQDLYSAVAARIDETRRKEAEEGSELAKIMEGFIRRKVIKQTVMTTVYGVTKFGARLQIARQLKDIEDFPQEHVWDASLYLVHKTFECLRTMFKSAREIQDWLTECALLITQVTGQYVQWITPLGLPVMQPYNKPFNRSSSTKIHQLLSMESYEPNTVKQKNAFPPNFIHSLDSTHMMLTSLYCERAGITFVSVHDCFWTHACDVKSMNRICREQFVALHSQPILNNLSEFLIQKYGYREEEIDNKLSSKSKIRLNFILGNVPTTGDFDVNNVLKSVYFFS